MTLTKQQQEIVDDNPDLAEEMEESIRLDELLLPVQTLVVPYREDTLRTIK